MLKQQSKLTQMVGTIMLIGFLSGCSGYAGIRTPTYDGEPVQIDEEAVAAYRDHREIIGENKKLYLQKPFSPSLNEPALDFTEGDPVLLESGQYTIGEDLPAGRVYMRGADSNFAPDQRIIHVGTVTIMDEEDNLYFETLFNDAAGIKEAYIDLREGHLIKVVGENPEIMVNYEDSMQVDTSTTLITGQYEVGKQIDPGTYEIANVITPGVGVMYWFQGDQIPRIIELSVPQATMTEEELAEERKAGYLNETEYQLQLEAIEQAETQRPTVNLETGDRLSLPMVHTLELIKVE
ncbi:hypothetical protein [Marinilactibacillus sp. Marseille-P9653]|uniref:hypothetical protein n=1 Tax=Marinilactibacillus sp. Marseille-P9653 TaxID=2866583 RepID=UPI001CE3C1B3|nr:hypothetical protein [Marinilactibacillus sp. Marseille-P9653]